MARLERLILSGQPHHVIQRGHNRDPIFFHEDDYLYFKEYLKSGADRYGVSIHAYVLMTNHYHLLATPVDGDSFSGMIQMLGRLYVRHINKTYERRGTLWEGRYKASLIDADDYLFRCMRYIENNPVRARMVRKPGNYIWSSYNRNATGGVDPLVQSHFLYTSLAATLGGRIRSYKALFNTSDSPEGLDAIRNATNGGWVLGSEEFRNRIAHRTRARVGPLPRGGDRRSDKYKLKG